MRDKHKNAIILLTCEHAVNTIPDAYEHLFSKHRSLLNSHRGIDFGALDIAQRLSHSLKAKLFCATVSRLLIDCNRSINHPSCFSEMTQPLPAATKEDIIHHYYLPYRQAIEQWIQTHIQNQQLVIHLSIHSFTPIFHDTVRNTDIGLLYDPRRKQEQLFARHWQMSLKQQKHPFKIRLNYPYQGRSDGFTTALRKQFPVENYIGIEVESNQGLLEQPHLTEQIAQHLSTSLPR